MDSILVFEQPECNTVDGRISPTLIEEPASSVEMVEIVLICLTPPEVHVANFKVTPEMARGVAISLVPVVRPSRLVRQPVNGIVLV